MSTNNIRLRTHYIYLITNNLNGYNYVGEKNRLNYLGCHWYTNGEKDILSKECPEGFWKGMTHKPLSEEHKKNLSMSHKKPR